MGKLDAKARPEAASSTADVIRARDPLESGTADQNMLSSGRRHLEGARLVFRAKEPGGSQVSTKRRLAVNGTPAS